MYSIFNKIAMYCTVLKPRYISGNIVYAFRNKKENPNIIILKFSRKSWILINKDGTWEHIYVNDPDKFVKVLERE